MLHVQDPLFANEHFFGMFLSERSTLDNPYYGGGTNVNKK
jgi:hypothetical protein